MINLTEKFQKFQQYITKINKAIQSHVLLLGIITFLLGLLYGIAFYLGMKEWRLVHKLSGHLILWFMCIFPLLSYFAIYKTARLIHYFFVLAWIFQVGTIFCCHQLFGQVVAPFEILALIHQTNFHEGGEFFSTYGSLVIGSVLMCLGVYLFLYQRLQKIIFNELQTKSTKNKTNELVKKIPKIVLVLSIIYGITLFNRTTRISQPILGLPFIIYEYVYKNQFLAKLQKELPSVSELKSQIQWQSEEQKNENKTLIFVLGESSNRNNWSLYGYERETTPYLKKHYQNQELKVIPFAKSTDAVTLPNVQRLFSLATKNKPDLWAKNPSMVQLAKAAGYQVTWITNQKAPLFDGYPSFLMKQANQSFVLNKSSSYNTDNQNYDEQIIPVFENTLTDLNAKNKQNKQDKQNSKNFIVIHLMGNHFEYEYRYPKKSEFMTFTQKNDDLIAQEIKKKGFDSVLEKRNHYDNSIVYHDFVLHQILELIKKQEKVNPQTHYQMVYLSDHGEEVGHEKDFSGHSFDTQSGYTIPMFFYPRKDFNVPLHQNVGTNEKNAYISDTFDGILHDLLGIKSPWYVDAKLFQK